MMRSRWMAVTVVAAMFVLGGNGLAQRPGNAGACPQQPANCPQQPGCGQGGRQVFARNGQGQRLRLRHGQQQGPPAIGGGQGGRGGNAGAAAGQGRPGRGVGPRQGGGQAPGCQGPCGTTLQQPLVLAPAVLEQLQGTLADELYARDFYRAAAQRFGGRRFANLARAEQRHAEALARAVRSAGGEPVADPGRAVDLPADQTGLTAAAVQIERDMIAAYEVLLAHAGTAALQPMLVQIQGANRRHLAANQR